MVSEAARLLIFVLVTRGSALLAFAAGDRESADELSRTQWIRSLLLSCGAWNGTTPLMVRRASEDERAAYMRKKSEAIADADHDGLDAEWVAVLAGADAPH